MTKKLYLAGPITGLTYAQATNWRVQATVALGGYGWEGVDPTRGLEGVPPDYVFGEPWDESWGPEPKATDPDFYYNRDIEDINGSDALLAVFHDTPVGAGTLLEIGYAHGLGMPVVLVRDIGERYCPMLCSSFLEHMVDFHCDDIFGAIDTIRFLGEKIVVKSKGKNAF